MSGGGRGEGGSYLDDLIVDLATLHLVRVRVGVRMGVRVRVRVRLGVRLGGRLGVRLPHTPRSH